MEIRVNRYKYTQAMQAVENSPANVTHLQSIFLSFSFVDIPARHSIIPIGIYSAQDLESLGKSRCKEMCLVEKCWIAGQKDMLLCNSIEYAGTGFLGDIMLSIEFVTIDIPLGGQKDLSNKEYS